MSVVHTQTETILFEPPPEPPVPPITVVSKYVSSPLPGGSSGAHVSIKVRNDSDFYYYKVWLEYTVNGVTGSDVIYSLAPRAEDFLYVAFVMPNHDVTVDMTIYASVIRMSAPMIQTSSYPVHTQTETVRLEVVPPLTWIVLPIIVGTLFVGYILLK